MDGIFPWNYLPELICQVWTAHSWRLTSIYYENGRSKIFTQCVRCNHIKWYT